MVDLGQFREAVQATLPREPVHRAVRNLYSALSDAIELRKPVCVSSGRCCRFEEFGHRLFVTTMEMATFLHQLPGDAQRFVNPGGCPFQAGKLCGVHSIRPFGCRVFFCDETATDWQQEQYSRFHAELKRLHEEFNVPYFYLEWRQALNYLGVIVASSL